MEDASKALLMAGELLLGVLILSVIVYLFSNAGNLSKEYDSVYDSQAVAEFNAKIEKNSILLKKIYPQNIVSLANFVYNYNIEAGSDGINLVVKYGGTRYEILTNKMPNDVNCFVKGSGTYSFADFLKTYSETVKKTVGGKEEYVEIYEIELESLDYSNRTGKINNVVYRIKDKSY